MEETLEKLRAILAEVACTDPETIRLETDLAMDLGMDSLDAIMVAAEVEDQFGVKIEDADVKGIRKVQDIVALLVAASALSGEPATEEAVGCAAAAGTRA